MAPSNQRGTAPRKHQDMIHRIHSMDLRTFHSLGGLPAPALVHTARLVSRSADGWLYALLVPPLLFVMKREDFLHYLNLAAAGFALERLTYLLLKNTIRRRRPPDAIEGYRSAIRPADRFSLPSGHTSCAFFVSGFLCFGLSLLFLPLFLWAAVVGLSRVVLGVHFPSDTVAGAALGLGVAFSIAAQLQP